jgi:hypothetical protein
VREALTRIRGWNQRKARLAYHVSIVSLLALGVFFRSHRYWLDPIGLWGDEASWARRLFKHSLTNFDFRPIGYMDVTQWLVHIYSSEQTLRLLSWAAGIASLAMVLDIGRHIFRSPAVRMLCLAVVVFHPLLIDMSREFKPYSLEFCAHLGLVWLFVRWSVSAARGWFYALLSCSVLSFLFAYNIVFLFPAIFGLLGGTFLFKKAYRSLLVTVLSVLAAVALICVVYFGVLRKMGTTEEGEKFWGGKYDVFYLPSDAEPGHAPQSHASWLAHKYLQLAVFPDVQRDRWPVQAALNANFGSELSVVDYGVWLALHAVGVVALFFPGRRPLLALLVTPVIVIMVFNWFGVWPFGVFRANTFLLAYYILIPMVGLDALVSWAGRFGAVAAAPVCLLFLVPNLTFGFDAHDRKQLFAGHSEMPTVLRRLRDLREHGPAAARSEKTHVLMDWYSCSPFEFYIGYSDSTRREFGSYLVDNFDFDCTRSPRGAQAFMRSLRGKSFFVVVTDYRSTPAMRAIVHKDATVLDEERVRDTHDLYYVTGR